MFERYTEKARQVVILAQDEARAFKHGYIGTEHLLLGLARVEEGLSASVLLTVGITVDETRAFVGRVTGFGDTELVGQIPFTPRSKKVLELSLREALSLGHNYVGTEHILLGLVRENDGVAARYLAEQNVTADQVRDAVIQRLAGKRASSPEPTSLTHLAQRVEAARGRYAKAARDLDDAIQALRDATEDAAA